MIAKIPRNVNSHQFRTRVVAAGSDRLSKAGLKVVVAMMTLLQSVAS
jgi:hypothetical protein